jgi:hypothetical protein
MECSTVVIPIILFEVSRDGSGSNEEEEEEVMKMGMIKKGREKKSDAYHQQYTSNPNQDSSLPPGHKAYLNSSRLIAASALMPCKVHSKHLGTANHLHPAEAEVQTPGGILTLKASYNSYSSLPPSLLQP